MPLNSFFAILLPNTKFIDGFEQRVLRIPDRIEPTIGVYLMTASVAEKRGISAMHSTSHANATIIENAGLARPSHDSVLLPISTRWQSSFNDSIPILCGWRSCKYILCRAEDMYESGLNRQSLDEVTLKAELVTRIQRHAFARTRVLGRGDRIPFDLVDEPFLQGRNLGVSDTYRLSD